MMLWNKLRLTVSSTEARVAAIQKVAATNDTSAVDWLLEAFHDRDGQVPVEAAAALGKLGSPRAVPVLIAAFKDRDDYIRWAAGDALARIGKPAVEPLITALRDPLPTARDQAIRALGQIGAVAIPPLVQALRSPLRLVRETAATALGGIAAEESVTALLRALEDRELGVRDHATQALIKVGKLAVPGLLHVLSHAKPDVRQRAGAALEKLGREPMTETYIRPIAHGKWKDMEQLTAAALDPLVEALADPSKEKRFIAVRTLANVGDERAVGGLIQALCDDEREVRETAVQALVKMGAAVVEPLLAVFAQGRPRVRPRVAAVLGYIGDGRSRATLLAALTDGDPGVRCAAAEALAVFKDASLEGPLLAALQDADVRVRFNAVGSLRQISASPAVVASLLAVLADEDSATRKRAAQALGNIAGPEAVAPLLALLRRETSGRLEIALAVAKIDAVQGVRPLLTVAVDDPGDAAEAVAILTELLQAAAAEIAPADLEAVAELPRRLEAARAAAGKGLVQQAVDAAPVAELAAAELIRRGLLTRATATAAVRGTTDSRLFPRRPTRSVEVLILQGMHQPQPDLGHVVDRSDGGLALLTRKSYAAGTMLSVRPARAADDLPSVLLEVRHTRPAGRSCRVGCKFVRAPGQGMMRLFG